MVELDAGLIQLSLQASKKAPGGFGTVGSPHCVKGSRDPCTHGKLVPYSAPPRPCSGKISLTFNGVMHLDTHTSLRQSNVSQKERVFWC